MFPKLTRTAPTNRVGVAKMRRLSCVFWFAVLTSSCSESSLSSEGTAGSPASGGGAGAGIAGAFAGTAGSTLAGASGATAAGSSGTSTLGSGGAAAGSSAVPGGGSNGGSSAGAPSAGGLGTAAGSSSAGAAGASQAEGGAAGALGGSGASGSPSDTQGCAGGGKLFCEDFEAQPSGAAQKTASWEPVANSMGTLTIDGVHARGQKALHVHTQGNGRAYISVSPFAPPSNSFFARMYVWVTAFPSAPNYAHYTLVEAAGTQAGMIRPIGGQYIEGNGALWGVGADGGPTGDWTNWKTSAPSEAGKWLCIEFELAASDNNIRVWIDGTAKPELSVSTKDHGGSSVDFVFPTFNKIWFGWWLYHAGPTPNEFDLWFDDIAIATTRLGCAQP